MKYFVHSTLLLLIVAVSLPAYSTGYVKLGDIKGESTDNAEQPEVREVQKPAEPEPAALLVPAVQKVRDAAAKSESNNSRTEEAGEDDGSTARQQNRRVEFKPVKN